MQKQIIVIATQNKGKIFELNQLLTDLPFQLKSISEFTDHEPEETGTICEENALIKARAAFELTGLPSLADDAGLFVDALNGAPGVYTSEFSKREDGTRDYPYAFEKLEKLLLDKEKDAHFVCVLAYVDGDQEKLFRGEVFGKLDFSDPTHKTDGTFGFDPVFIPKGETQTFAQLGMSAKKKYSHRANASKIFVDWFLGK